jgi:nucleotide-binding universal stress UspA family protein
MTEKPRHGAVVVGVDASRAAVGAACFAAAEAARRSLPLRIVHAVTWFDALIYPYTELDLPGLLHAGAQSVLETISDVAAEFLPADRLSTSMVDGHPVDVLVDASADASLVVVGGRGVGGVSGLILGTTSHGLVASAACPVVVVPDDTDVATRDRRSVVVGVEGRGDEEVLALAFGEAAARGTDLVAVHAWQDAVLETALRSVDLLDRDRVMAGEERALAEALAGCREKEPDVVVREVVVRDRSARALLAAALTAQLLVVGHHRRRRLGSTTHAVLHRASCPVAVVPLGAGGAG